MTVLMNFLILFAVVRAAELREYSGLHNRSCDTNQFCQLKGVVEGCTQCEVH